MEAFAFPVERKKVYLQDGTYVGKEALIRPDTGKIFSVVGEDYQFLPHEEAIQKTEEVLHTLGDCQRSGLSITHDGARIRVSYDFIDKRVTVKSTRGVTDDVAPRLIMTNSYDGQMKFGFILGAYQFICSNGLRIGYDIFDINRKHTSGLDLGVILDKASSAFSHFMNQTYPRYVQMGQVPVPNATEYLEHMKEEKQAPARLIDVIMKQVADKAVSECTEWDIYSEFTNFLTHTYKKSDDRRDELNKIVAKSFGL